MNEMKKQNIDRTKNIKHWIVLAIATSLSAASLGMVMNTIGLFFNPMATSLGFGVGEIALHSTLLTLSIAFTSLIIPKLLNKFNWKSILITGTLLASLGTLGMAYGTNLMIFYILGVVRGVGTALFAMVPMTILINNWFEEKNGLALSIANGASGIVGAVFSPIITSIISNQSWQSGFVWQAVLIVVMLLPAILYPYSIKPEDDGLLPYGFKEKSEEDKQTERSGYGKAFSYVSIPFILLIIFAVFHSSVLGIPNHIPAVGESIGMTAQTASLMMSAMMIGNIAFKLVTGTLSDRFGVIKAITVILSTNVIGILLIVFGTSPIILVLGAGLFGSIYSIAGITFPLLSKEYFGREVANQIYPILTFVLNMVNALAITGVGYMFDFTGSYLIVFVLAIAFNLTNIVLIRVGLKASKTEQRKLVSA